MPPIPKRKSESDPLIEAALADWAAFEDPTAWSPSKKTRGNLWRFWDGKTVTIYRRRDDGRWGWCIADDDADEKRFSREGFDEIADAKTALGEALGVGGI